MSVVLVLGATGFIGNAVCCELIRLGFHVYGTTRKQEKAAGLLRQGITPVITSATEFSNWESMKLDIVVECLGDYDDATTQVQVQGKLCQLMNDSPSFNVVFTSGAFGYGSDPNDPERVFSEADGYALAHDVAKSRVPVEAAYRDAGAVVVNPVWVYGNGGGGMSYTIRQIAAGGDTVDLPSEFGNGHNWYSTVHVRDLAVLYGLVVTRIHTLRGQLFNAASNFERLDAVAQSIARHFDNKQVTFSTPDPKNAFAVAAAANMLVEGRKARRVLGWSPLQLPFTQLAKAEVDAWKRDSPTYNRGN